MERKYYLRGLGLGIAMTAIIMGVALSGNKTMTDEEIIARAKELGMVENTVLSNSDNESDDESTDKADVDSQDAEQQGMTEPEQNLPAETEQDLFEPEEEDSSEQTGQDTLEPEEEDMPVEADSENVPSAETDTEGSDGIANASEEDADMNDTTSDEPEETANEIITSAAVKTITVKSGDGSYTVAKKLADVGVVTSAETFDTFLCQNGYDKRLRTGTFSIPADASDEQIARIVTGAE